MRRATDTESRRRQPPRQAIEPTKLKTCNQNKNKSYVTHACLKNTRNDLPSGSSRSTERDSALSPSRRPRGDVDEPRGDVDEPRGETIPRRRRATERDNSETSKRKIERFQEKERNRTEDAFSSLLLFCLRVSLNTVSSFATIGDVSNLYYYF